MVTRTRPSGTLYVHLPDLLRCWRYRCSVSTTMVPSITLQQQQQHQQHRLELCSLEIGWEMTSHITPRLLTQGV